MTDPRPNPLFDAPTQPRLPVHQDKTTPRPPNTPVSRPVPQRPRPTPSHTTKPTATVLFICNANVCRSPLAEALFATAVAEAVAESWGVSSAGLRATPGEPMIDDIRAVLAETRYDVGGFRATALTAQAVHAADAVITMTRTELREVLRLVPAALHRTTTLNELHRCATRDPDFTNAAAGPDRLRALVARTIRDRGPTQPADPAVDDIPDPVGKSRTALVDATAAITAAIATIVTAVLLPQDAAYRQTG